MNATAIPGVWTEEVLPGLNMRIDTNANIISFRNPYGSNIRYECTNGIYPEDVVQIRESILRTTKVSDIRVEA